MRILWIVPKSPLGAQDGARHATCSLLRHLSRLRAEIHLICLHPDSERVDAEAVKTRLGVSSCSCIPRRTTSSPLSLRVGVPWTFRTFAARGVREALRSGFSRLLGSAGADAPTFALFDGLHTFAALDGADFSYLSGKCSGIVYRAHNFETALWEQCAHRARTPWFRWLFNRQSALVADFERRAARNADVIAPVSEEDAKRFRGIAPETSVAVVRIGMDFPMEEPPPPKNVASKFELLFVGRLDWMPNRNGLAWFLEKVWPALILERPEAALNVAGTGDARWLRRFDRLPGVRFLGSVEDLAPLYESCVLCVAPIFQGSGTRVKILESARYGRAVLTTALGAEGLGLIPGRSYYRAETPGEWVAALKALSVDECRSVGLESFRETRARFDGEANARRLFAALRELDARRRPLQPAAVGSCPT